MRFDWFLKNKTSIIFILVAITWFIFRESFSDLICKSYPVCFLYPETWPQLLGITTSSSFILIGLLAGLLFALPFGRAGLVTTLIGIHLAEPVFGIIGVTAIFLISSLISITITHEVVAYILKHEKASWVNARLKPLQDIFSPSIQKNSVLWLAIGNLVGSQWHMSALGILCKVETRKIITGLMIGNIIGFALLYAFSQIPNLDIISNAVLVLTITLLLSAPLVLANRKKKKNPKKAILEIFKKTK